MGKTKFFYDQLGWRGLLIEPQLACHEVIKRSRPDDIILANASCADFGSFHMDIVQLHPASP